MRTLFKVLADIATERIRQDDRWGEQIHPDGTGGPASQEIATLFRDFADDHAQHGTLTWKDILTEEFYEALAETEPEALRTELIQVAAVALVWVEDIDRRDSQPKPLTKAEHVGRDLEQFAQHPGPYQQEMMDAADALLGRRGAPGSPYDRWEDV